jgi:ATP-dependent Zn protease
MWRKRQDPPPPADGSQKPPGPAMPKSMAYIGVVLVAVWLLQLLVAPLLPSAAEIPYSEFKTRLAAGDIVDVTLGTRIEGVMKAPGPSAPDAATTRFVTVPPPDGDPKLVEELGAAKVTYRAAAPPSPISTFIIGWILPIMLIVGLWSMAGRSLAGRMGGGVFGVGRSKATEVKAEEVGVTFKDVGGADEAIAELQEIIQFLRTPEKFARLGGRIPKGVLLVGPPGTGKTLIARATAGEAGVRFFETSGSEFVEMFVGVGAARVRDLFEQARSAAPAIVFIDEIDAIGQSRGGGVRMFTNDEREQTLNQLLAEIDGFKTDAKNPVIIMAATNRPEILDPALLRAGRFDRQVALGNPDLTGRLQILKIHSRRITLAPDFDLERAARVTPGFSGADLANVINEAALMSARRNATGVTFADFEAAIERVVGGLEQRSRVMNSKERQTVAYHECDPLVRRHRHERRRHVGGKNASLGEMRRALTPLGIRTPDGFATTADAYREFLRGRGKLERVIREALAASTSRHRPAAGGRRIACARPSSPPSCPTRELAAGDRRGVSSGSRRSTAPNCDVAVRSSATAEDLPEASFAGQQETYLNIHGEPCCSTPSSAASPRSSPTARSSTARSTASITPGGALGRRAEDGALGPGVRRRDVLDRHGDRLPNAVLINGAYGLGESVVQGTVNPDEFYVFKPTLATGLPPDPAEEARHEGVQAGLRGGGHAADAQRAGARGGRERFVLSTTRS